MPRKTKDQEIAKNEEKNIKKTTKLTKNSKSSTEKKASNLSVKKESSTDIAKSTPKSTPKSKNSKSTKSDSISKVAKTKTSKKVSSDSSSKNSSTKKTSTSKTAKAKKETSSQSPKANKESTAKSSKTKKSSTTKASKTRKTSVKSATSRKRPTKKTKTPEVVEYYDLPYRYNQTVVKILAQTPTNLFVYWDISDEDRENYKKEYGENFFETTRPVLIVHNDTLNYSFEIEINDFANSWYLNVADSKCNYRIELGRRPNIKTEKLNKDYIYISSSNEIESPNDKILFDKKHPSQVLYFRNVKSGNTYTKQISDIPFVKSIGKIYNIYDLYKAIYKNENIEEIYDLSNPSSGNPSSGSLSSRFK